MSRYSKALVAKIVELTPKMGAEVAVDAAVAQVGNPSNEHDKIMLDVIRAAPWFAYSVWTGPNGPYPLGK